MLSHAHASIEFGGCTECSRTSVPGSRALSSCSGNGCVRLRDFLKAQLRVFGIGKFGDGNCARSFSGELMICVLKK